MKNQGTGQTWGRKMLHCYSFNGHCTLNFHQQIFPTVTVCYLFFYFSLVNFIFNLALLAIFITQFAHSCFPFSFVVEALSAKVMYRTGRSADRPTTTGTPRCGRRPAAGVWLPLTWPGHSPPVGGAKPQRAAANGNRAGGSRSPGIGWC